MGTPPTPSSSEPIVVLHVETPSPPSPQPNPEEEKAEARPVSPPPPAVVKPTKYAYSRQELLEFRHRPECLEPPTGVNLEGIASADDAGKGKQPIGWRGAKKPALNNNTSVRGRAREGVRGRKDMPLDIDVAPLQVTENRYRVKDFDGEEKMLRILNGILNKLTPESFDNLLQQVLKMEINTVSLLEQAVDAVFEKALSEPTFSPVYAEFCEKLSTMLPPVLDETGKPKKFKSLLLNQCQKEFENQDRRDKDAPELDDAAKKQRQLGTIRFIGELFVRGLLKANIMFDCIKMLSDKPTEENIEALCKLLRTVGKTLDKSDMTKVNEVFATLKDMTVLEGLNFRFRFMLQDVIDLRREKWVGRIETLKAKKLSDVHKQDEEDKKRKERQDRALAKQAEDARRASAPTNRKTGDRYINLRSPQKAAPSQSSPDDGFMTQKKGKRAGKPEVRPVSKPIREETRVPKSKVRKSETEEVKKPTQPSGFGVLEVEPGDSDDIEELEDGGDTLENDQSEESEKSREEALKSIERLLCDYLRSQDMKEAIDCIEELKTTQFHSDIVDRGVNLLFDHKEGPVLLVTLFRQLATDGIFTRKHLETGLAPTLEILDDLIIDFPLALTQLAAFVAPLIVDSMLSLSIFSSEAASNLKGSGSLGKWFDLTLKNIQSLGKDAEFVKKLVQASKLDFAALFKSPDLLESFLTDHQELKALAA
jgi:translation initiation factor 4G